VNRSPLLQTLFVIAERVVFLAPQVTMAVLIGRILGREFFGQYTLLVTWATLFQTLANFGISECLAREIGREPGNASTYFAHGLVLGLGFAIIALTLMAPAVWAMAYPSEVTEAILVAGGTLLPAGIVGPCRGILLATRRVQYMIAVGAVESVTLLALNTYWVVHRTGLLPIAATLVLAKTLAAVLALGIVLRRVTAPSFLLRRSVLRQLGRVSAPFGVAAQLPAIRVDILLLSKLTSFGTLALYSAASKVAELSLVLPLAFYLAMLPRVAADLAHPEAPRTDEFRSALAWYFAAVVPLGIGLVAFAEPVLRLTYGAMFVTAAPLLRILMLAFLLTTFDAMLMIICRATGFQGADLKLVLVTAAASCVLNVILIPRFGVTGAALAAPLSILAGMSLRWRLVSRSIVRLDWATLIGPPLAASLLPIPFVALLMGRMPWPLVGVGYVIAYTTIAGVCFPFLRSALHTALQQHRALAP
jgi:O-antigen/teichoic acid export membrane protein